MKKYHLTAGWGIFVLLAVYYLINRYPGPAFIDSGELALASYTLGIPHPTGYPLYVILTHPFTLFFNRPITAVTVAAAFMSAGAGLFIYHIIYQVLHNLGLDDRNTLVVSILAALAIGIAPVVCEQGVTNEVYGLALLLNMAAILAYLKFVVTTDKVNSARYFYLACYLTGMALCNHLSSIMLLPALLIVTVIFLRRDFQMAKILIGAAAFVIPLTVYLVLPMRAAADPTPVANWGDVATWDNFYRHISGWQFKVWMFTGNLGELWNNLKNFIIILIHQFPLILLPFPVVGCYFLYRRRRIAAFIIWVVLLVNILFGINYSIPDISSYFLVSIVLIYFLALCGLWYLFKKVGRPGYLVPLLAIVLIWQGINVYRQNYKGDYTLPEDYARNMARSAQYNALIMTQLWDHQSPLFYLQQAEYFRPDLKLIDKELLRRSWYFKHLHRVYPGLYDVISDLVPPFLSYLAVFEEGGDFDRDKLENYYQAIINRMLLEYGTAYVDYGLEYKPRGNQYWRRQGLLFRVDTKPEQEALPQPQLLWHGRDLNDYGSARARMHLDMIRQSMGN